MLPRAAEAFPGWSPGPLDTARDHPHFVFRRGRPDDFERVYDLADRAHGRRRPRAQFDWLYRRNPLGAARCWLVTERGSNRLVASAAYWPWPLALGNQPLRGALSGDSVVLPDFQRRGVRSALYVAKAADPQQTGLTVFGWPNEKSTKLLNKLGEQRALLGPLWEAFGSAEAQAQERIAALWSRVRSGRRELRVEEMGGFPGDVDAVTARWAAFAGIWSPHDVAFLNWRYRGHPLHEYRALALLREDDLAGYAVVRVGQRTAQLMEFVAPPDAAATWPLLRSVRAAAREAGCRRIHCFAPPAWRHWPALLKAGFRLADTRRLLRVNARHLEEAYELEEWQLLPGDTDDP